MLLFANEVINSLHKHSYVWVSGSGTRTHNLATRRCFESEESTEPCNGCDRYLLLSR